MSSNTKEFGFCPQDYNPPLAWLRSQNVKESPQCSGQLMGGGSFDVLRGLDKSVPSSCTAVVQRSIVECPFLKPDTGSVCCTAKQRKKERKKTASKEKTWNCSFYNSLLTDTLSIELSVVFVVCRDFLAITLKNHPRWQELAKGS